MKIKKITASILVVIVLFATLLAGCNVNTVIFNMRGAGQGMGEKL